MRHGYSYCAYVNALYCPILFDNKNMLLVVIDLDNMRIKVYDSFIGGERQYDLYNKSIPIARIMPLILLDPEYWGYKKDSYNSREEWIIEHVLNIPQQNT